MPNVDDGRIVTKYEELNREVGLNMFSPANEPNYLWQGPDGQQLLRRATGYERHSLVKTKYDPSPDWTMPDRVELLIRAHEKMKWPFNSILSQDGSDFTLAWRNVADAVHQWNSEYSYPRLREAIFDDYFHAIEKETVEKKLRLNAIAGDENNQWSDQDYAAARSTGLARRLSELLPATETLASLTQSLAGGGDQWINLFQGYHRLLAYFEHTNAKASPSGNMTWYETELEENREMVTEAAGYQQQVFTQTSQRLARFITRSGEKNLIVFNPLPYQRTDLVRAEIPAGRVVDSVTGAKVPVQQLADGTAVFVAENIPATGYKTYSLLGGPGSVVAAAPGTLENRFYRLQFHPATGVLTSLFDKTLGIELVEPNAPHAFNEYLYEFRSHTDGLNFNSVWSRLEKADAVTVSHGPVADVLTITGRAEGVRALKQTILLYHALPRVDFGLWLDKAPFQGQFNKQHEAVFVALPLAIPNFAIHHELPGCVIEPYRQQVEGSATDHYAIRSFTDLSNGQYGVTVSPLEGSLVCYGAPTTTPLAGHEYNFKRDRTYPTTSRLYLYLMDNMFDCNIAAYQQGPVRFQWALRSHAGDWKAGGADRFGRSVQQPLLAWRADGKNAGALPASASFLSVDAPNVMLSVLKPAEGNGRGFILRLHETTGKETTATVNLPMLPPIEAALETSLVENDRSVLGKGNTFTVTLRPFGVKTIRVTCAASPLHVTGLGAKAVADMQVDLSWRHNGQNVSHFNIYRDTSPECAPTQLNFIGQTTADNYSDRPQVNPGGWLRSCLAPKMTYYYRVVPVDQANNPAKPGAVVTVTTSAAEQANLPPVAVEGLRAILVSPISQDNFVNLLFRTACEPDVVQYEVYRGIQAGFGADAQTLVGTVKSDDLPPRSEGYGESKIQYKVKEYDHAMFADKTVKAGTTYYYKVRAVDAAGQKGASSEEAVICTKK
jgi:fibronectin type 3 domain-containing protein